MFGACACCPRLSTARNQRSDKKPKKGKAWQDLYKLPHLSCTCCEMWRRGERERRKEERAKAELGEDRFMEKWTGRTGDWRLLRVRVGKQEASHLFDHLFCIF